MNSADFCRSCSLHPYSLPASSTKNTHTINNPSTTYHHNLVLPNCSSETLLNSACQKWSQSCPTLGKRVGGGDSGRLTRERTVSWSIAGRTLHLAGCSLVTSYWAHRASRAPQYWKLRRPRLDLCCASCFSVHRYSLAAIAGSQLIAVLNLGLLVT